MNQEYLTLIIRHLEGSLQSEESKRLQRWLCEDVQNHLFFEDIKRHWEGKAPLQADFKEQPAWEQLSERLNIQLEDQKNITLLRPFYSRRWRWSKVAAVFIGFLIVSSFMYWWFLQESMITYSTLPGQVTTLWLPDSSLVTLFENTTLTYQLTSEHREIILEGEAFFDVKKLNNFPFLVRTSLVDIRVLGTSFNIKAYQDEENAETTLIEGRVEISGKDKNGKSLEKKILQPQQKAIYSMATQKMKVIAENKGPLNRLAECSLIFKNERVDKVLEAMSREHKITIRTEKSQLNRCTITADFSNQSLDVALDLLCELIEAFYRRSEGEVYISGEGC